MNFSPRSLQTVQTTFAVALEPAFDFEGAEYRALQARSRSTAFQGPRWLTALHRDVAAAFAADAVTVTVRDPADGRLMLVLPLARYRKYGVIYLDFADFGLSDYLMSVYDPADAPLLFADATLPTRLAATLPRHDVLSLTKLTGDDAVLDYLFPRTKRALMRISAYPAQLGSEWPTWRNDHLDASFRKYLDMKRRRLKRTGTPEFATLTDPAAITRAFEALRRYRSARFKAMGAPDILDIPAVYDFYVRHAIAGASDGTARTQTLSLDGEPVAIIFGLVQNGVYSLLLVGLDVARHARLSPGLLAIEDTLRAALEAGDSVYDFTIGDHPYKIQFGGEAVPLYEAHQGRTLRGRVAVAAIALLREAKRTLKPLLKRTKSTPAKEQNAAD